jgi:hypothetical protein
LRFEHAINLMAAGNDRTAPGAPDAPYRAWRWFGAMNAIITLNSPAYIGRN